MNPLITLYITNYNYGKFIDKAIKSALGQTFTDYEILIIDDGSNDSSTEIINKYQDLDNVYIIFQKNKGLTASNNIALKMARGKYIIRLDADDYLEQNCFEMMVSKMEKNQKLALVFPDYYEIDASGKVINQIIRHDFDKDVTLFDSPAHGACTMFRTRILREIGGYDESFSRQDGYYVWLKIIELGYEVSNINSPLFYYRQHGSNLTNNEEELLQVRSEIIQKHIDQENYKKTNVLCIVPVRGNNIDSRSNPLNKLGGKYLIDWTLEILLNVELLNQIIVSTPDENLIQYCKSNYEKEIITYKRSSDLAQINTDLSLSIENILHLHCEKFEKPDFILILNIQYPFRKESHIAQAINLMRIHNLDSVVPARIDENIFFNHNGDGLHQITKKDIQRLERNEMYKKVGGMNLVKTEYFKANKRIMGGKIGYIQMPKIAEICLLDEIDWIMADALASNIYEKTNRGK